MKNIT